jgi:asparagine synthetase B (glutamine-hydrolysing)
MCGIAFVWRGVVLKVDVAGAEASPPREQWEGIDESPSAALARSGLRGAQLLRAAAASEEEEAADEAAGTAGADDALVDELAAALHRRGPDQSAQTSLLVHPDAPAALCIGSTLGMRGPATAQPLRGADDSLLLWNGEVFGGGVAVGAEENDTAAVMAQLAQSGATPAGVVACLAAVAGPWACIFWQPSTRSLWFGHDRIGRRSLLLGYNAAGGVAISSVAPACAQGDAQPWQWHEVPPSGLYQLQLTSSGDALGVLHHHPWPAAGAGIRRMDALPNEGELEDGQEVDGSLAAEEPPDAVASADQLLHALDQAVRRRVEGAPEPTPPPPSEQASSDDAGVSSGARVAVLFSGGVDCMVVAALAHRHRPPHEPIDLLNVAFGSATQPEEEGDADFVDRHNTPDRQSAVAGLAELRRIAPTRCWQLICVNRNLDIDSLGAGKAEALPLMFPAVTVMDFTIAYALRSAAQGAGALWSGDEGEGGAEGSPSQRQRSKPALLISGARVVLSGLGADEQCVGYKGRHRTRFAKGGWDALALEIERDIGRLWLRNLGRDDRMIADHGKEVRYPYLDEDVMALLESLPLWHLADLRLPDGVGDKRIIRGVSRRLGLPGAAGLPKRAIQFGSRSSKCFKCNSNGNAHVDSATLSDQTAGRKPKKQRPSYAQRRASKKNRGTQYPGRKADQPGKHDKQSTAPPPSDAATDGVSRVKWAGADGITAEEFFWQYQVTNRPVVLCPPLPKSWGTLMSLTKGERHQNDTTHRIPDMQALLALAGADTVVPVDVGPPDGSDTGTETVRVHKTLGEFAEWWTGRPEGDSNPDGAVWYLKDWHLARDLGACDSSGGGGDGGKGPLYEPLPHFAEEFDWLNGWWDHLNAERRTKGAGAGERGEGIEPGDGSAFAAAADKGRLDDYRFVYLGPKGSWTPLHHDVLASYSWSSNLTGLKRWLLFPPEATPLLYDKHGLNLATDAREGSEDDRRTDEFPGLSKARELCLTVLQGPGETMFVPSGWHHQVHNEADTLSVNHNWFTSATLERAAGFLRAESAAVRAALADLKPPEAEVASGATCGTTAGAGTMGEAERAWMAQCERLQEANAAMGLGDFVRMLDVFSARSAGKLLGQTASGVAGTEAWRAAHELEAVRSVLQGLLEERFVAACPQLKEVAVSMLRRVEGALSSAAAADGCRLLRLLKLRHKEGGHATRGEATSFGGGRCEVTLEVTRGGRCKLALKLPS